MARTCCSSVCGAVEAAAGDGMPIAETISTPIRSATRRAEDKDKRFPPSQCRRSRRPGCGPRLAQVYVQVVAEALVQPALDGVDLDAPRIDQRADRVAVADVHANVLKVAPDDEVARPRVVARDASAVTEPVVVPLDAAVPADLVLQPVLGVDEPDETDAIELVRSLGVMNPGIADLGLAEAEDPVELSRRCRRRCDVRQQK